MKKSYRYLLSKKQARDNWRKTTRTMGAWLNEARREQDLSLVEVSDATHIPASVIDDMEIGQGTFQLCHLLELCKFYGLKINTTLMSVEGINRKRYLKSEPNETAEVTDSGVDEEEEFDDDFADEENANVE